VAFWATLYMLAYNVKSYLSFSRLLPALIRCALCTVIHSTTIYARYIVAADKLAAYRPNLQQLKRTKVIRYCRMNQTREPSQTNLVTLLCCLNHGKSHAVNFNMTAMYRSEGPLTGGFVNHTTIGIGLSNPLVNGPSICRPTINVTLLME